MNFQGSQPKSPGRWNPEECLGLGFDERVDVQVSSVPQLHDAKGGGLVLGECCPSSTTKGLDLRFVDDLAYFLKKSTTNGASIFFGGGFP